VPLASVATTAAALLLQYQHLQVDNPTSSNSQRLPAIVHSDNNLTIRHRLALVGWG
jgi:hypothetical protein